MSLCNVYGYLTTKTVKLSDSYQVRLKLDDSDFWSGNSPKENRYALKTAKPENGEIELCECTSVTLPSYKPKEEIFEYGNNSKTIIYMDPTSLGDLEIELIEHYSENGTLAITSLVNLFLSKLFDEDTFEYKLTDYIPELTVYVFNNIFTTVYLKYVFKELKLVDYSKFDLDYSSADIAKWTLKFSYRSFYVLSGEEDDYAKETAEEERSTAQESPAPTEEAAAQAEPDPAKEPPKAPSQPDWFFSPATTEEVLAPILETPVRTEPASAAPAAYNIDFVPPTFETPQQWRDYTKAAAETGNANNENPVSSNESLLILRNPDDKPAATAKTENSAKEQSKPELVKEQVTPIVPPVLQQLRQVATALTKPDSSNNDVSSSFNSSLKKINKLKNKQMNR